MTTNIAMNVSETVTSQAGMQAGMRLMMVAGLQRILVSLFYPTHSAARALSFGNEPFTPVVAFNGKLPDEVKGLILLSHGTGANMMALHPLAQALAQRGYLAAAIQHPCDTWDDRSLVATEAYFAERPRQVSRVLDALLSHRDWRDKIHPGRIGAAGHSAGGYTVLALAGGVADPRRLVRHCESTSEDTIFCQLGFLKDDMSSHRCERAQAGFDVIDERIRAVVAMAPLGVVFDPASLKRVTIPVKIYTAQYDTVLVGKYHGQRLRTEMPRAEFEEVPGAAHFAFMAQPTQPLPSIAGDPAENPPEFDRAAFHARLQSEVADFFERQLDC